MKKEIKLNRQTMFKGRVFHIHVDEVLNHSEQPATREVVEHHGGVAVLAIHNDEIYLIKQFRYAVDEFLIEAPAGKLELGEDPFDAAKRELKEETGIIAQTWDTLGFMYPTPGYSTEKIYLYLASDLSYGDTEFDQDELIETIKIPLNEALKMIEDQQITDSKTIILIHRAFYKKGH